MCCGIETKVGGNTRATPHFFCRSRHSALEEKWGLVLVTITVVYYELSGY
jgi:hypothetical protein